MTPPTGATAPVTTPAPEYVAPPQQPSPATPTEWGIPPEFVPTVEDIVIQDDKPVDNLLSEKNVRLLTEPLYSSWTGPGGGGLFVALANVGLFHTWKAPPLVPDVMLSLDVRWELDLRRKETLSYFAWIVGKMPDVVIEIVSNREGGEDDSKLRDYARLGIPYYVIFDPDNLLGGGILRIYDLHVGKYQLLATPWLDAVGLGLRLWQGTFEDFEATWLRWCDRDGRLIPTGTEGREQERQRAESEHQRAENERQRADQANQENERLRKKLRELGVEPTP
jgi:Putative restriction endonuclease